MKNSCDEDVSSVYFFGSAQFGYTHFLKLSWPSESYFLRNCNLSISLCLQITFDNKAHSGKIKIYFDSDADIEECKDLNISGSSKYVLCLTFVDYGMVFNTLFWDLEYLSGWYGWW